MESVGKGSEFFSGKDDLTHVETNSELGFGDATASELVKISEELGDSNSLFFAALSELGDNIINIIWDILLNINTCNSWSSLWVVVEGVVEVSTDSEELLRRVNIVAEIEVVDFINVTLIHIGFAKGVQNLLLGADTKLTERSQELMLSDMLVLSNVEILEHWLQVDSLDSYGLSILFKNEIDVGFFSVSDIEILSSSQNSVIDGYWSNRCCWLLLDAIGGENGVDAVAESVVVDHVFGISGGSILRSKGLKLLFGQVEVQHGQDLFELVLGDSSLSKFIKIIEELLDSNSLHDDLGLKSLFNVFWVVGGFNSLLHETVINDIESSSVLIEIGSSCISQLTVIEWLFFNCLLWNVLWEHVLWMINIMAEFEIVDFSDISFVEVLSDQELVLILAWWNKLQLLQYSSKLLSGNMAAIGSVIVLELWLDKNSFVHYFGLNGHQKKVELIHLGLIEIGRALGT